MTHRIYIIGIDLIVDNNNQIKILEIQNAYESIVSRAVELTKLNPVNRLSRSILNKFPNINLKSPPQPEMVVEYAKQASINEGEGKTVITPNFGLEAMCRMKWLFYYFCSQSPELSRYIPETSIVTLATLETARKNFQQLYLFKPVDMAGGNGILLIPSDISSNETLHSFLIAESYIKKTIPEQMQMHYPFLIQRYLHDVENGKPKSKSVIRIYAAVSLTFENAIPSILIFIDDKAAYQHIRKQQTANDFTGENNRHEPYTITEIVKAQLKSFLDNFFRALFDSTDKITYRCWENIAKTYLRNFTQLNEKQRLLLISQFSLALLQEQRFTSNMLTARQCFALEKFIGHFFKSGDATSFSPILTLLTNSFCMLIMHNFTLHKQEVNYSLGKIMLTYSSLLKATNSNAFRQIEPFQKDLREFKPTETLSDNQDQAVPHYSKMRP